MAAGSVNGGAMIGSELRAELETKLGSRVVEASSLPVGFGLTGLRIALADGRRLAVKASQAGESGGSHLELEAYMLGELARLSELPVPQVHYADADLLVMDFIETDGGGITESVQRHAGELIAKLHATKREQFGYARDTLIGPLRQPNPASSRWVPFFRDHRLLFMANGGAPRRASAAAAACPHRASGGAARRASRSSPPSRACCMAISGPATC